MHHILRPTVSIQSNCTRTSSDFSRNREYINTVHLHLYLATPNSPNWLCQPRLDPDYNIAIPNRVHHAKRRFGQIKQRNALLLVL